METKIVSMPAMRLACVRHVGRFPEIGSKFGILMPYCRENGISFTDTLAVYYGDPATMQPNELTSDAAVLLTDDQEMPPANPNPKDGEVHGLELPATKCFANTYVGSYSGLDAHWGNFTASFKESGLKYGSAPEFEIYRNDCSVVPESELITELYTPIADAT